jgi:hypothetical protein
MMDSEELRYRWRIAAICLVVVLLILAFVYDLESSTGKSGDAISQVLR